jgi:hypothetical protein
MNRDRLLIGEAFSSNFESSLFNGGDSVHCGGGCSLWLGIGHSGGWATGLIE